MAATRGFKVVRLVRTAIRVNLIERLRPGEFMILDGEVLMKIDPVRRLSIAIWRR
jgi:16S rRNA U516 pseudouridylate synthase RsuA-like enzyme